MSDLTKLTISETREKLDAKEFSAEELANAFIHKMADTRELNAYIKETPELALSAARSTDARIARGESKLMDGIPVAIKDLFCTKGVETTAASKMLADFKPCYESTVTTNLWNSGAVMLGKTNLDEFAMGSSNIQSAYGAVISPLRTEDETKKYVPGGSSGGSAAAVAADSAMCATGTDTGGSIRQPAAFTGIVGMKPTYGLCSRWGVIAFASSLDQPGPLTKTVTDAAIMLEAMAGYDPKDATSLNQEVPHYSQKLTKDVKGLRVGIPEEYIVDGMDDNINAMWQKGIAYLRENGAEIIDIKLPHTKYALPTYYILAPAEASSNLARYDGVRYGMRHDEVEDLKSLYERTRAQGFGDEVQRRICIGTYVLSAGYYDAYYLKAQKVRRLIANDFVSAFKDVDVILAPTTPNAAFAIGEEPKDPVSMYMNDVLTVPANIAGLPAISIPAGLSDQGLPLGLQLIGPALGEQKILNSAYFLEESLQFNELVKEVRK